MYKDERIFRLLNYKNLLYQLKTMGFVKVFSDNIADSLSISSSLVRRDFNTIGIKGNQKGGYLIAHVLEVINKVLGKDEIQRVVIVGMGRIGEALLNYHGFKNEGIEIVAGFDVDTKKLTGPSKKPVLPMNQLPDYITKNQIKIAIVAVPDLAAQQTIDILRKAGIRGVLSFSSLNIKEEDGLIINSISIEHKLENLIYKVNTINLIETAEG